MSPHASKGFSCSLGDTIYMQLFFHDLANPQYGVGGFDQYFITNLDRLKQIVSRIMTNR